MSRFYNYFKWSQMSNFIILLTNGFIMVSTIENFGNFSWTLFIEICKDLTSTLI